MARKNVFDDIAAEAEKCGRLWETANASGDTEKAEVYRAIGLDLCGIITKWSA